MLTPCCPKCKERVYNKVTVENMFAHIALGINSNKLRPELNTLIPNEINIKYSEDYKCFNCNMYIKINDILWHRDGDSGELNDFRIITFEKKSSSGRKKIYKMICHKSKLTEYKKYYSREHGEVVSDDAIRKEDIEL